MPFKEFDIKKEIRRRRETNPEFDKAYSDMLKKYELIERAKKLRKKKNISLRKLSRTTGMKPQEISRIEKYGTSLSVVSFIRYLDGISVTTHFKCQRIAQVA